MNDLFLDTNIIIDVLANRQPFAVSAAKLFDLAEKGKIRLFISALSYSNIYYILKKTTTHKELTALLSDVEALAETLDVTKGVISRAIRSDFNDFEDAIQYHTALSNKKITVIVTRNAKDFKNSKLTVLTPEEAVSAIANNGL
jgi:predicted nucleic acid-binding protein